MSVEVLLIPLGIAAAAAWRESRSTNLCAKCKSTRLTDQTLLVEALQVMGAQNIIQSDDNVRAHTAFGSVMFQRVGDVFLGRVDQNDNATDTMLSQLEHAVGRVLQVRNVAVVRQRAQELGLRLVTEQAEDGTVKLVFEENA
ncbi:hypothetical protein C5E45_20145 [Nocardia nova]|uniref:DUF1257 domain-containing protein n=1 Tax=Nocardia nova TaxID=37330 RepID=A0A2S6AMD5_9NOCA|nr:hypothetical protein [Nocardia nova]PPJ36366.1 hypothetical protein C5E45_20145 [Nocardia nova]